MSVQVPVREVQKPVYVEKPVEVIVRKNVEQIVYKDRFYDVIEEVEVVKEVPKEVIEYRDVPVERIIERVIEVPVERILEVEVEKIVEIPVEKIITKTKIETREVEVIVEVIKEVPKVIEKIEYIDVHVDVEEPVIANEELSEQDETV